MENLILFAVIVDICIHVFQIMKGTGTANNVNGKAPFTGKRTCKVVLKTSIGKSEHVVLEDLTHPDNITALIIPVDEIDNTEDDSSSVGLSSLAIDGIYFISDEPITDTQKINPKQKFFANRIK